MRSCAIVPAILFLAGCQAAQREEDRRAAEAVVRKQVDDWNRGDLDGFLRSYLQSSEITFFSGSNVSKGFVALVERYRTRYTGDLGQLAFEALSSEVLGPDAALVRGRWRLKRANEEPSGLFTLILRRTAAGWRIVHDHTST